MARYSILAQMMTLPKPLAIGEADTPADAVRKARAFTKDGQRNVQIGDNQSETYFPAEEFAAKHGIR
jgi:hypothetical protein